MKHSFILTALVALLSTTASAAPMVRVIDVTSSRTIIVDHNGVAATVRLAVPSLNPSDEPAAVEFLRSKLIGAWVLVEAGAAGESYVYRSPDGLFINGEISRAAWTESSTKMTYIGESYAGPQRTAFRPASMEPRAEILPPTRPHRVRSSPRGATRIPKLPKSVR